MLKKNKFLKLLFFILFVAACIGFIFLLFFLTNVKFENDFSLRIYGLLLLFAGIVGGIIIFTFIHELGHLFLGLASRYKLVYLRLFFLVLRKNEKNKFRFKIVGGATGILGQCIMKPPHPNKKNKTPYYIYNLGGLIFSYISIIAISLYLLIAKDNIDNLLKFFLIGLIYMNIIITLINTIPTRNTINDVRNNILAAKYPEIKQNIFYQIEVASNLAIGLGYSAPTYYQGVISNMFNHLTFPVILFKYFGALENNNIEEMQELYNLLFGVMHRFNYVGHRIYAINVLAMHAFIYDNDNNKLDQIFSKISEKDMVYFQNKKSAVYPTYYILNKCVLNHETKELDICLKRLAKNKNVLFKGELISNKIINEKFNAVLKEYLDNDFHYKKIEEENKEEQKQDGTIYY